MGITGGAIKLQALNPAGGEELRGLRLCHAPVAGLCPACLTAVMTITCMRRIHAAAEHQAAAAEHQAAAAALQLPCGWRAAMAVEQGQLRQQAWLEMSAVLPGI